MRKLLLALLGYLQLRTGISLYVSSLCEAIPYRAPSVDMERFLRSWRQDALNRGQHDSAIYIGDKVLALTSKEYNPREYPTKKTITPGILTCWRRQ